MLAAVSDNPLDNSLDNLIDNLSGNFIENPLNNSVVLGLTDGTGSTSSTSSTSNLFISCGSPQFVSFHAAIIFGNPEPTFSPKPTMQSIFWMRRLRAFYRSSS